MTVSSLRENMTMIEFLEWQAYYGIQNQKQELAQKSSGRKR